MTILFIYNNNEVHGADKAPCTICFYGVMSMLYKIGTLKELYAMELPLPKCVKSELVRDVALLDCEYGEEREWGREGGYSVILEGPEDVAAFRDILNYDDHPCEWAVRIGEDSGWLSALYLMNDDFAVMAFMPIAVAPEAILSDLEDDK